MRPIDALTKAALVLDEVRGNINPERGFATELERDVVAALEAVQAALAKSKEAPAGAPAAKDENDPREDESTASMMANEYMALMAHMNAGGDYHEFMARQQHTPTQSDQAKNAARYEWLREQHWSDGTMCVVTDPKESVKLGSNCPSRALLDEAIDLAMKEKP